MQTLNERNTYTPTDIPQVSGNCDRILNRGETLSVSGLKTSINRSDAALIGFRLFQNGTRIEFPLKKQPLSHRKNTYADTLILQTIYGRGTLLPRL